MAPASVALVQWEIVNLDNGEYKIKTRGTYVGVMPDGHLWAFLLEDMLQGAEWKIEAVPQHGDNAFMCVLVLDSSPQLSGVRARADECLRSILRGDDPSSGWMAPDEDHQQVSMAGAPFRVSRC